MKCGHLQIGESGNISGVFLSWSLPQINIALRKSGNPVNDKKLPTHEVIGKNPHGAWVVIGAAWENKIKNGEKSGQNCYSLLLEEPTLFERPVRLSAFPKDGETNVFTLEFDRATQSDNQQAA